MSRRRPTRSSDVRTRSSTGRAVPVPSPTVEGGGGPVCASRRRSSTLTPQQSLGGFSSHPPSPYNRPRSKSVSVFHPSGDNTSRDSYCSSSLCHRTTSARRPSGPFLTGTLPLVSTPPRPWDPMRRPCPSAHRRLRRRPYILLSF